MSEDIEAYQDELELALIREYRDVVTMFRYVVETDRRLYLANSVDVNVHRENGDVFFEIELADAWVWDFYRPSRFIKRVRVISFKDVSVEELLPSELPIT